MFSDCDRGDIVKDFFHDFLKFENLEKSKIVFIESIIVLFAILKLNSTFSHFMNIEIRFDQDNEVNMPGSADVRKQ